MLLYLKKSQFAIRRTPHFDVQHGNFEYELIEFSATVRDILYYHGKGYNISFDLKTPRVVCKRPIETMRRMVTTAILKMKRNIRNTFHVL